MRTNANTTSITQLDTLTNLLQQSNNILDFVVYLLQVYNLRASEVLNIHANDIVDNRYAIVRACKHSRDIVIRDRYAVTKLTELKKHTKDKVFNCVNYNMLYRHIRQYYSHLLLNNKRKKNFAITHYWRYANAQLLNKTKDVALVLNHNSYKSAKYYNKNLLDKV